MKLRIEERSIRIRMKQDDVARFAAAGRLEEVLRFGAMPGQQLTYGVKAVDAIERIDLRYQDGRLTLLVPAGQIREWAEGDLLGFDGLYEGPAGILIRLAVEKDLKCLHREGGEQDVDTFPNPMGGV